MKVKRFKKFQRSLSFYRKNFGFEEPYQILIDGTFANAALIGKVNMREQFPKYFEGQCKLLTSPCALIETEKLGPALYGAVQVLKGLKLHKCQHSDNPVPASECLKFLAGKSKRRKATPQNEEKSEVDENFVVATQDQNLRTHFRMIIGVPLLYLHGSTPVLERPSDFNTKWAEKRDKKKLEMTKYQKETLQQIKSDMLPGNEGFARKGTRKRKRVGPNPLSCKKAKKQRVESSQSEATNAPSEDVPRKKRKRIKVRVPMHIKELKSELN